MAQPVEPGKLVSVPDYDPETDPVLARLRSHGTSGGGRKALVAVALVGIFVVGGWYAYSVYDSRSGEAKVEKEFRAQAEAEPAPPPPISPLQAAEGRCVENLAATEFAGLPVVESENGRFFVIYTARAGDSIGSVASRSRGERQRRGPEPHGHGIFGLITSRLTVGQRSIASQPEHSMPQSPFQVSEGVEHQASRDSAPNQRLAFRLDCHRSVAVVQTPDC